MRPLAIALILLTAAPAIAAAAQAREATLELDPARTVIEFTLNGWPHTTLGTFHLIRGTIHVDPESGKMSGIVRVDAASGESGDSLRDSRMRASTLEADRFREITFAPAQALSHGDPHGEFPVRVEGTMSLHGTDHEFTIDATVSQAGDDATIRTRFVIPYVEWGLEDPSVLMFRTDKEVAIDVTATGHVTWSAPAGN
jgi:polyisoprenoid-binding protein YceI